MTTEEKQTALEHLFRQCPDVLTPYSAAKWTHQSKNTLHALIKLGKLIAYPYRGTLLISKADLIDYLVATSDDKPVWSDRFNGRSRRDK